MRANGLILGLTMLAGCIQDPAASADPLPFEPQRPAPPPGETEPTQRMDPGAIGCGADLEVDFEVLQPPVAGMPLDIRVTWDSALDSIWDCCPYQPLPWIQVDGETLDVPYHAEAFVDASLPAAPDGVMKIEARFCETMYAAEWPVGPSPFEANRADLAACEVIDSGWNGSPDADLRLTDMTIEGRVAPGERIIVRAEMAEVSGMGHGSYPGMVLSSDQLPEQPGVGQFYAIFGCDVQRAEWVVDVPEDLVVGETLTLRMEAAEPLCRRPECQPTHDHIEITRRILPPI
jgi:hypothetical protein